ncbi:MAG: 5-formyltetrahydrofolate cyclo-ligase [Alphaproteobacteria bacterium]|nr:5-formyltetrahydrofolate cyclo-ligase [Alphaproteobacteria bacterium]
MRDRLKRLRAKAQSETPDAGAALAACWSAWFSRYGDRERHDKSILAGYWPLASELDPRPVMLRSDLPLSLPVVTDRDQALEFRCWGEGEPLEAGIAGTLEPLVHAQTVRPDILLVPGLAFDDDGYRLGYGGGYYDRTLTRLRTSGKVLAIGVCYEVQRVDRVPRGEFDVPVDLILTPEAVVNTPR